MEPAAVGNASRADDERSASALPSKSLRLAPQQAFTRQPLSRRCRHQRNLNMLRVSSVTSDP